MKFASGLVACVMALCGPNLVAQEQHVSYPDKNKEPIAQKAEPSAEERMHKFYMLCVMGLEDGLKSPEDAWDLTKERMEEDPSIARLAKDYGVEGIINQEENFFRLKKQYEESLKDMELYFEKEDPQKLHESYMSCIRIYVKMEDPLFLRRGFSRFYRTAKEAKPLTTEWTEKQRAEFLEEFGVVKEKYRASKGSQ